MQGVRMRSICFMTFLLFSNIKSHDLQDSPDLNSDAQLGANGNDLAKDAQRSASSYAHAEAYSRAVVPTDYIFLHDIPGGRNSLVCSREGEFHQYWSPWSNCMLCVCLRQYGELQPVCAICGCSPDPRPFTTSRPTPPPPTLPPIPEPPSCSPLPTDTPFQNPLNPCQICICRQVREYNGEIAIRIDCENNPQCVLPTSTLPPIPDDPIPLPLCQRFPENVWFPHPNDVCRLCKCTVEYNQRGFLEPHISCVINSDCYPTPPPEPSTTRPVPDPTPWPPRPNPIPGPTPHESCYPFSPNQPFQHPWDECQVCVCTESRTYRVVNVEVDCFTKSECCNEYAIPQPVIPDRYIPGNRAPKPFPVIYPGGGGSSAIANAEAIVSNGNSGFLPSYPSVPGLPGHSGPSLLGNGQAAANALANANSYGGGGSADASAAAQAFSGLYSNLGGRLTPQYNPSYGQLPILSDSPGLTGLLSNPSLNNYDGSSAIANAEAVVNTGIDGYLPSYPSAPGYSPGLSGLLSNPSLNNYDGSSAIANAEAVVNKGIDGYLPSYPSAPGYSPGLSGLLSNPSSNIYDGASAIANAEANVGGGGGGNSGFLPSYPSVPGYNGLPIQNLEQAGANANAYASSNANSYGGGGSADASAAAQSYSGLYSSPSGRLTPQYNPSYGQASAQSEAQASGGSSAMSKAQAYAGGRPIIRSRKGLCKYAGDKYHLNCQACFCERKEDGDIYAICYGTSCQ